MKRNRSIRVLPLDNLTLLKHPLPEPPDNLSDEDSVDKILSNLRDLGTNSSSSSSWGGDCKTEASKLVQEELDRMDRVLRAEEPIPDNYDAEEYTEWMEFFPNLCIQGYRSRLQANCLKISPLDGATRLPKRQSSSRALISSQMSSSKWLKDDDYCSLPFLKNGEKMARRGILKNSLVLPPIEISPFRSISATPRRETKSLSALSEHKYSGCKRK